MAKNSQQDNGGNKEVSNQPESTPATQTVEAPANTVTQGMAEKKLPDWKTKVATFQTVDNFEEALKKFEEQGFKGLTLKKLQNWVNAIRNEQDPRKRFPIKKYASVRRGRKYDYEGARKELEALGIKPENQTANAS